MHTTDWHARRVIPGRDTCNGSCETMPGCECLKGKCAVPQACQVPIDEEVSPLIGILVGSTLGALIICGAVWLWRSLL